MRNRESASWIFVWKFMVHKFTGQVKAKKVKEMATTSRDFCSMVM
jgi:hypothetical protein